jgi:3-dehydroquinate synthase
MRHIQNILVRAPSKRYLVVCGEGSLASARKRIESVARGGRVFVLTSLRVWRNCGKKIRGTLRGLRADDVILFDDHEAKKHLATVESLCRELIRHGADRRCVIVAVGGGVVGDVAGFVAASYLRGVKLVHVPTTLVAQVDSAIGGKTGVNLPEGKNLVGAFYQPDFVVADSALLRTLPAREYRSGIYEVIKYAVIRDAKFFAFLERSMPELLRRDAAILSRVITECVRAKAVVTVADERESGLREILNFGHTFGHAIEAVTRYRGFLHGEAVGWGMIAATILGIAENRLAIEPAARIIRLIRRVGDLPRLPHATAAEMIRVMRGDKKSRDGHIRFVIPDCIGHVERGVEVPDKLIATVWRELSVASGLSGRVLP